MEESTWPVKIDINWDGYTKASIKLIYPEPDGSLLCDICNDETGLRDINISFEKDSPILNLSPERYAELKEIYSQHNLIEQIQEEFS